MPEPTPNPEPVVYQQRVVLRGVSPLIWRRLLVRSDSRVSASHLALRPYETSPANLLSR
jgi:hypothetical protein